MGVANMATLDTIAAELRRDRDVRYLDDGSIGSIDDADFVIGFQISVRREFVVMGEFSNAPGTYILRPINSLGVLSPASVIRPRTLSHVAYFVPDVLGAETFYVNRLGFRCTDRLTGTGPFLQPEPSHAFSHRRALGHAWAGTLRFSLRRPHRGDYQWLPPYREGIPGLLGSGPQRTGFKLVLVLR